MSELKETLLNIAEEKRNKIIPENIKSGVQIFDINGTFTSDADATAGDILKDKTAYVNGEKVIGTLEVSSGGGDTGYNFKIDLKGQTRLALPTIKAGLTDIGEIDCSSFTTFKNDSNKSIFYDYTVLKTIKKVIIPPNMTDITAMFNDCASLVTAPDIDTSNVSFFSAMFLQCSSLVNVPVYNASNAINLSNTFLYCNQLSDESLNNIMATLLTLTDKYTGTKKLTAIGLSTMQAAKCASLPNYQALVAKGWTQQ